MTAPGAATFALAGPLAAFPFRLAAREVRRHGGILRRGISRRTTHVVFGRRMLERHPEARIAALAESARKAGKVLLSERAFLAVLGLLEVSGTPSLSRLALLDQSGLDPNALDLLALFDAFEQQAEPYSFRDLILARKYAGLIAGGASWGAIARSVHRSPGPVASLTAMALQAGQRDAIYARLGDALGEVDGQLLLAIDDPADDRFEELFALALEGEEEGRFAQAAALYERCMALDPADASAAFNAANCHAAAGAFGEARRAYLQALKVEPGFVEAWFNFAGMLKEQGDFDAARRHLAHAIEFDRDYADAVYNLAAIEFEAGDLAEARRWWARYLELDDASEWARNAARGIRYVDLHLAGRSAG